MRDEDGDLGEAAGAVGAAAELDDDVDGGVDLVAERLEGDLHLGHGAERLEPHQGVLGAVGVDGGERAVVAGGHGLEHVEGLAAADLADDDPVGAHPQGVADEVADGDVALALDVGGAGFQAYHVGLLELEFGGVLDGDDALVAGDEAGEGVEQGGLPAAGAAGDDDVEAGPDEGGEQHQQVFVEGAELDQLGEGVGAREAADGEGGAGQGERRDDDVDAFAGGEPGVDHGVGLVDAAVDGGDDAFDGLHQLLVRGEPHRQLLDAARSFDEDRVGSVDHDLGDGRVFEEWFEDAEAECLVDDAADELGAFGAGEDRSLAADDVAEDALQPGPPVGGGQRGHLGEVDLLQQLGPEDRDQVPVLPPGPGAPLLLGAGDT